MRQLNLVSVLAWSIALTAVGCAPAETAGGGSGTGGTTPSGTGGSAPAGSGGMTPSGTGGSTPGSGGATTGSGGAATPGSGGATTGSGGAGGPGTGGVSTGTGGRGGATATGGATAGGGSAGRGATATGGAGTGGSLGMGVTVSAACKIPAWPSAVGAAVNISGTREITGVYDGKMALHEGTLEDCSVNGQGSTNAMFEVADGGTIKNIIMGNKVGDGIHCVGSCTIDNVWFANVCDDAVTMLGGAGKTATIQNSGFKNARDKTIQHNGDGSTVIIKDVFVDTAGKLYRSCGDGCSATAKRTVMVSNVVAIAVDQVVGVSTNDKATLTNICGYRTGGLCKTYLPGGENESPTGANGTAEGPSAVCTYKGTDTHALVDKVAGPLQTDVLCTGSNSAKDGMTNATACVAGFETCVKGCAPGTYGFKQVNCVAGKYAASGSGCVLSNDPAVAPKLASSNAAAATTKVTNNTACTTQWAWGTDGAGKYCVCVAKPGYYQTSSGWFVWDCQSQWW